MGGRKNLTIVREVEHDAWLENQEEAIQSYRLGVRWDASIIRGYKLEEMARVEHWDEGFGVLQGGLPKSLRILEVFVERLP